MTARDIKLGLLVDDPRTRELFDLVKDMFNIFTGGHFSVAEASFGKAAHEESGDVLPRRRWI
jgi:hypothetical protein